MIEELRNIQKIKLDAINIIVRNMQVALDSYQYGAGDNRRNIAHIKHRGRKRGMLPDQTVTSIPSMDRRSDELQVLV